MRVLPVICHNIDFAWGESWHRVKPQFSAMIVDKVLIVYRRLPQLPQVSRRSRQTVTRDRHSYLGLGWIRTSMFFFTYYYFPPYFLLVITKIETGKGILKSCQRQAGPRAQRLEARASGLTLPLPCLLNSRWAAILQLQEGLLAPEEVLAEGCLNRILIR
jgi:hypothetical protein